AEPAGITADPDRRGWPAVEGDRQVAGGDEPARGLQQPGDERGRPARAAALRAARGCLPAAAAGADAARAGLPAPDRIGDEDAPVRARRTVLSGSSRCRRSRAAESSLGRPGLAPDNGRDPAAVALRRAHRIALKAAVLTVALLLTACGTAAAPDTGASSSQLQAQVVASELVAGSQQRVSTGMLDHNTPVHDASVHVRALLLQGTTVTVTAAPDSPSHAAGLSTGAARLAPP